MTRDFSRRAFLGGALGAPHVLAANPRDVRIVTVETDEEHYLYRTPIKFGGAVVDRVTLLNVRCTVEGRDGKTARGFGSMPLGNVWSFPSKTLKYDQTLYAMQTLAGRIRQITATCGEFGHPVELNHLLEPEWLKAATEVSAELKLAEPIPKLAALVAASPIDAALHDAYGKFHGRSAYHCYTREFLRDDLSRYLGPSSKASTSSDTCWRTRSRACRSIT